MTIPSPAVRALTADFIRELESLIAARAVERKAELVAAALGSMPRRRGRPPKARVELARLLHFPKRGPGRPRKVG